MGYSPATMIIVRLAQLRDLESVVPLFDAYRQFYGQQPDPVAARQFLEDRIHHGESTILIALQDLAVVGFTQLFPSFSSMRAARIYVLNDLYVTPSSRRSGAGRLLLQAAADFAAAQGAVRLSLSTAHSNLPAQRLYESMGWKLDEQFRTYTLQTAAR